MDDFEQVFPTDLSSVDQIIVSTIPFLDVEQIYKKVNENNLDQPQYSRKFIEDRINALLFSPLETHHFSNSNISFGNCPLTEEEEFMIIFLAKFQKDSNASSLLTKYRYLFGFNHPFSSLLAQIEQNSSCSFNKQSSIVESYATTFAQLERIYGVNEFSQDELVSAQITEDDFNFISNSLNYMNDKSVPEYKVQIDTNDPSYPIDSIESNFFDLTLMNAKIFAFLQGKDIFIPFVSKNFLIGDSSLSSDVDFNLKSIEEYKPVDDKLILALIMLKNDLNFYIENVGSEIIIIDGFQIWPGETTNLTNNSVIEMSGCDFVFCINHLFISKLRELTLAIAHDHESKSNDHSSINDKETNGKANES